MTDINKLKQPNYYRQARERLEKAGVDIQTICDILELIELQYKQGMDVGAQIVKDVYKLETK